MSRTAWDDRREAVEYGSHLYRASRYSFELSLTSDSEGSQSVTRRL